MGLLAHGLALARLGVNSAVVSLLQASFGFWRIMLFVYWMILSAFSIAVLLAVYTYQFADVPRIWYNWTHWPQET